MRAKVSLSEICSVREMGPVLPRSKASQWEEVASGQSKCSVRGMGPVLPRSKVSQWEEVASGGSKCSEGSVGGSVSRKT